VRGELSDIQVNTGTATPNLHTGSEAWVRRKGEKNSSCTLEISQTIARSKFTARITFNTQKTYYKLHIR
jgi:hypothetical protein